MATVAAPPEIPRTAPALPQVERYFQISLFLLLITGFITLAATGKLDLFSVAFVLGAFAIRGLHLVRKRQVVISERWTSALTLVYVLIYAVDYFALSHDFVAATVHLVLFGMVVKIFSVRRDRDLLYLGVLAFLMVLAASVLTVNTAFLVGFALFLIVAIATFASFEMRRAARIADRVEATTHCSTAKASARRVNISLSRTALALGIAIMLGASLLFFVLPRISGGYLGAFARGSDPVSGFRDNIQLGQIGRIQQSTQVVMHLQVQGDHAAFDGKLRGSILTRFDGRSWADSPRYMNVLSSPAGRFDLSNETLAADPYLERTSANHKTLAMPYRLMLEPTMSSVLFLAKGTLQLDGNFRQIAYDSAQSYINLDGSHPTNTYWAVANITPPDPNQLRSAGTDYPARITGRYLQLPPLDPRISALARTVTASAATPYDKARVIESYLQQNYGYTLELPALPPKDPLANFLFERRQGHCEYFASAMAIMLRTLAIPTRVATGFRGGEYNDLTGSYIIRARDAHAWVEVYFPNQGWVTFDPTAATPLGSTSMLDRFRLYADAMNEFWHEWVVNYDFAHQRTLTATLTTESVRTGANLREWVTDTYQRMLQRARAAKGAINASPLQQVKWAALVIGCILLIVMAPQLVSRLRAYRLAHNPQRAPEAAAALWYGRATQHLARYGWRKSPTQTPVEFAGSIDHEPVRVIVEEFTEEYEHARFGHSPESASRLPELFAAIKNHGQNE
jgi:protein-glutamine gamma-glutamyltransferase